MPVLLLAASGAAEAKWVPPSSTQAAPYHNALLAKLRRDEPVFGGFVTIPHYQTVENLAAPGFLDFMWIEAEHGQWGAAHAQRLVAACENKGVAPVVRVPQSEVDVVKKFVGSGAWGFVMPNIGSAADAKRALATVKYPPEGTRRAGAERANDFLMRFGDYMKVANSQMLTVLMMETPEAVRDIEEWVKLPGLDVVHLGPYDLSLRLNVTMDSALLKQKVAHVEEVCREAGVALGGAVNSLAEAKEKYDQGYRFFTVPGDMQLLQGGISEFFQDSPTFQIVKRPARTFPETGNTVRIVAIIGASVLLVAVGALLVWRYHSRRSKQDQGHENEAEFTNFDSLS